MKRGTDGVSSSRIVVVIVARSVKIVRVVSIVIVAGTQPAILIKTVALKVRIFTELYRIVKIILLRLPPSIQ